MGLIRVESGCLVPFPTLPLPQPDADISRHERSGILVRRQYTRRFPLLFPRPIPFRPSRG